jgi:hypothetical protein
VRGDWVSLHRKSACLRVNWCFFSNKKLIYRYKKIILICLKIKSISYYNI